MKLNISLAAMFLLAATVTVHAQQQQTPKPQTPALALMPAKDNILVFVSGIPGDGAEGFVVYRADAGSEDFKKLTETPVSALKTMDVATSILGTEGVTRVFGAFKVFSIEDLFKKYAEKPTGFNLLSLFSIDLAVILGRTYTDKSVTPDASYRYKVALVDASGKEIKTLGPSDVSVKPPVITPPAGFKLEAKDGAVTLAWDKPAQDFNGIGWNIYRGKAKEGPFDKANKNLLSKLGDPAFHEMLLENGVTYYYYVAGTDLAGNLSAPSEVLAAMPKDMTPPSPPTDFSVKLGEDGKSARLVWGMNLEPDLASYNVYRGPEMNAEKYDKVNDKPVAGDKPEFNDISLEEGSFYYYRLTAVDKTGNESAPSVTEHLQPPDKTPPSSPIELKSAPKDKAIVLTWKKNTEKDLYGYFVYRGSKPDALEKMNSSVIEANKESEFIDHGVVSGEKYYYAIGAVDGAFNESVRSEVLEVKAPDSIPPEPPAGIFAQYGDYVATVSWPPNMEKDLAGYRLYRSESADGTGEFAKVGDDIPNASATFEDKSVVNGKKYWYYVTAFDDSGNEGKSSDKTVVMPRDDIPPLEPTGVTGEPLEDGVALTWAASTDKDIAGFKVLKSDMKTGVYTPVSGDALLSPETLSFKDDSIADGKEFWYKIIAADTSGNESPRSAAAGPLTKKAKEQPAPEK